MNPHATISLACHGLELRCPAAGVSEDRPLADEDYRLFARWAARHQELARKSPAAAAGLLQPGCEIFDWLNGAAQFLTRLPDTATTPLVIEFAIGKADSPLAHTFLDAPWELAAHAGRHWSLRSDIMFCPVRRIGKAVEPPPPSPDRLRVVFMAAAPRGASSLNYEAEEASILTATRHISLDLVVEESGALGLLSVCVAREKPDVLHISCHGTLAPEPGLLLEDDVGDSDFVKTSQLVTKLAARHTRLLFLSACETAEGNPVLDSLARSLVRSGVPSVLGWAAPVLDAEATILASHLYEHLAAGEDLAQAVAYARLDLGQSEQLPEPPHFGPRSREIRAAKGEVDAALQLHTERLGIFEGLGDKRSRAVTLGDTARIRARKGEVDAALQLHTERLGIFEGLEDQAEIAHTLWSIAQIELQQKQFREAFEHLFKSYEINQKLGRLDGICYVGLDLGQLLCAAGQPEAGRGILTRSREGFRKLGQAEMVNLAQALIDRYSEPSA